LKPLPKGWEYCQDEHGDTFYYNSITKKSQWEHPCDAEVRATINLMRQSSQQLPFGAPVPGVTPGMVPGMTPTVVPAVNPMNGMAMPQLVQTPSVGSPPLNQSNSLTQQAAAAGGAAYQGMPGLHPDPRVLPIMPADELMIYVKRCLPLPQSFVAFVKQLLESAQSAELEMYQKEYQVQLAQKKADIERQALEEALASRAPGRGYVRDSDLRQAEDRAHQAEQRLHTLERDLARLESQLRDEEKKARDADRKSYDEKLRADKYEREIQDLSQQNSQLRKDVQEMRNKLMEAEHKGRETELRAVSAEARATKAEARAAAAEAQAANVASISPVTSISQPATPARGATMADSIALSEAQAQIGTLREQLFHSKRRVDELERRLQDAQSDLAEKTSQLESAESKLKRARDKCNELERARSEYEERIDEHQTNLANANREREKLSRKVQTLQQQVDSLEAKLAEAQEAARKATASAAGAGAVNTEEIQRLERQVKDLESSLERERKRAERLTDELSQTEDLRRDLASLRSKNTELERQLRNAKASAACSSHSTARDEAGSPSDDHGAEKATRHGRADSKGGDLDLDADDILSPDKRANRTDTLGSINESTFAYHEGSEVARTLAGERRLLEKERSLIGAERASLIERRKRLAQRINAYRQAVREYEADVAANRMTPEQTRERKAQLRAHRDKLRQAVPKYTADIRTFRRRLDEWFQRNEAFLKALADAGHGLLSDSDTSDLGLGLGLEDLVEFTEFGSRPLSNTGATTPTGSAVAQSGEASSGEEDATKAASDLVQQIKAATEAMKAFRNVFADVLPQTSTEYAPASYDRYASPAAGITPSLASSWRRVVESSAETATRSPLSDYLSPAAAAAAVPHFPPLDPAAHIHSDVGLSVARASLAARLAQNARLRQQLQAHQQGLNTMHDLLRKPPTGVSNYIRR